MNGETTRLLSVGPERGMQVRVLLPPLKNGFNKFRSVAQAGRARVLGTRCRPFDSGHSDQLPCMA